ncbi:Indole-3-glycerol phosphate synthase [Desulfovibrio sp. X2]|uniref:indole-3-glycerol-phosphate synthase n=1 Tax=Desulfovibrio sp. X2 TaxID=941449 RepID=UPI0003589F48|nr:indole-3-glycerol-phosphate synthase [Desulfovibrio sp. X2]EPR36305.1 Indole-3-glycerol phosphate synthase [Desulfovibrio sp. X2]
MTGSPRPAGILEKFRAAKAPEIAMLREREKRGALPSFFLGGRPAFAAALAAAAPLAVIAEYKRASPSQGDINLGATPLHTCQAYADAGAAALSILTERVHFKGDPDFLTACRPVGLPMLRKDFILDEVQIRETAATPASAFLLIARMLPDAGTLARFLVLGAAAGLEAVVEIFDEADLAMAREAGSRIIQVNNRDLDTLAVDLGNAENLMAAAGGKQGDEVWIAASGVKGPEDAARMARAGYDAVLVGTSLMSSADPAAAVRALIEAAREAVA